MLNAPAIYMKKIYEKKLKIALLFCKCFFLSYSYKYRKEMCPPCVKSMIF